MDFLELAKREKDNEKQEKQRQKQLKKQEKKQQFKKNISNFFSSIANFFDDGIGYWLTVPVLWPYHIARELKTRNTRHDINNLIGIAAFSTIIPLGLVAIGITGANVKENSKYLAEMEKYQLKVAEHIKKDSNFYFVDSPQAFEVKSSDSQTYLMDIYFKGAKTIVSDREYHSASYMVDKEFAKELEHFALKERTTNTGTSYYNEGYKTGVLSGEDAEQKMQIWKGIEQAVLEGELISATPLSAVQVKCHETEISLLETHATILAEKILNSMQIPHEYDITY